MLAGRAKGQNGSSYESNYANNPLGLAQVGLAYGGGGGGGLSTSGNAWATARNGKAGAAGIVIVEY